MRRFLTRHLRYSRPNHDYQLSQMVLSLVYPIILGLDRFETASLLPSDSTFQYLTGLPGFLVIPIRKAGADFYCRPTPISGNNYTESMITYCSGSFTNPIIARD